MPVEAFDELGAKQFKQQTSQRHCGHFTFDDIRESIRQYGLDDDRIDVPPSAVDVSKEIEGMKGINKNLLYMRTTPKNKADKMAEQAKLDAIKKAVSDKVDAHVKSLNISPKWGSGSEGLVVHPPEGSEVPRFKVTSDNFRKFKADKEAQAKFKDRLKGVQQ